MSETGVSKNAHAGFDPAIIDKELTAAIADERAGRKHGAIADVMRRAVIEARKDAMTQGVRGDKVTARLSRSISLLIKVLFANVGGRASDIAVCAVGGFGRGALAPFSDIDLLFLHKPGDDSVLRPILDAMLYPLWDAGLKVGHGVHTPESALRFVKDDMIGRTAYLDMRFLCGSKTLFGDFDASFRKFRKRSASQFVAAKLAEQDARQTAAGETRYLAEPDVKEGKGGLRDIQTIQWIYKYVFDGAIGESVEIEKLLGKANVRALVRAERFLWSVRVHMHDLRGRADDQLTFDIQPKVAGRLAYADRRDMSATERLMRHYFVTAVETGRLTRILCARLEEHSAKKLPRLPAMLPKALQSDEAPGKPNIRIRGGRLDFDNAAHARENPRDYFRYFRAFSKKPSIDFHPDALALIAEHAALITSELRNDPVAAALFKGILESNENPVRTLRVMTETGLLSKYVPVYGEIVGRIQYGLYRVYTLDEQLLRAFNIYRDIRTGKLRDEHPISTRIVRKADDPYLITLALFLYETAWTVRDKAPEAAQRRVLKNMRRLGLEGEGAKLAAWASVNHLSFVRTAERRNLTEPRTIAAFAQSVGSREKLDLMVVLATCYRRVVGHASWDDVLRRHMLELYELASAWFEGGEGAVFAQLDARAFSTRAAVHERLKDWLTEDREAFLAQLSDEILRGADPDVIVRFAHLARGAAQDNAPAAVTVTPRDGDLECIIYADDRPGLLADLAGVIATHGLSVRSVQAMTTRDGRALDVLSVQSIDDMQTDDPTLSKRLHQGLLAAAGETLEAKPKLARRFGDRRQIFNVTPLVRFDADASDEAVVFETEGLDRPGLLHDIASALEELGVSIQSAHVATYGERAVDGFYLTDARGDKITDRPRLMKIEKALYTALGADAG